MRLAVFVLVLALTLEAGSKPEFEVVAMADQKVAMRDGVALSADLYLPGKGGKAVEGKFPVILYRTPYNKSGLKGIGEYLAVRGYAAVMQDVRGRFKSEGAFYAFLNEGPDGYDTIEWAAAQPWSNGKVGTAGASYLAWDQYLAAMQQPPHLNAIYAEVGGNTFYDEFAFPGGAPNPAWGIWILNSAASSPQAAADPTARAPLAAAMKDALSWLAQPPSARAEIFAKFPQHRKIFEDFYKNPTFNDYWNQKGWHTASGWREIKDVPVFFASGWYDYFGEGLLENFAALTRSQKTPKRLWMGPWPHGLGRAECGNGNFGSAATVDMREVLLDWFDFTLKLDPLDTIGQQRVRYFRMGGGSGARDAQGRIEHGGSWLNATTWPPRGTRFAKYFLQPKGGLAVSKPANGDPSTFDYDPANPVPTTGGRYNMVPGISSCAQDQSPLDGRTDILRFQTAPLTLPVDVTGRITARLSVSSDAPDTDFTVKLIDVYPNGYALGLADGVLRMRNREGKDKQAPPLKAGEPYDISIDLGTISNLFTRGHRIRIDVSSSNYPRVEPNPNTGEAPWEANRRVKARNTVHHDTLRSSFVELPIRP